jgi:hypothetical protein
MYWSRVSVVAQLRPLQQSEPQLVEVWKGFHPFLESAGSFDAAVALWRAHESRTRVQAEEVDLFLEIRAHVLGVVVVSQLHTGGDLGAFSPRRFILRGRMTDTPGSSAAPAAKHSPCRRELIHEGGRLQKNTHRQKG